MHIGTETASAAFVLSIWARSAPAALYIPGLELVFLAAFAIVTAIEMVAMNRSGSLPIFSSNRAPWRIVGGVTQIILFSTLAVLLW